MAQQFTSTRERIVEEAMRLFAENGFRGASVAQIEAAAGLSPGAGGLYHHFGSKEEVLAVGIRRHLERLDAFRDIRRVLGGLGDLRSELTVAARFFLAELDSQTELFRVLVSETRRRPHLLDQAVDQLIASTFDGFADWVRQAAGGGISEERAATVAALALGSLLSSRLLRNVLGTDAGTVDDEVLVSGWVDMVIALVAPDRRALARTRRRAAGQTDRVGER